VTRGAWRAEPGGERAGDRRRSARPARAPRRGAGAGSRGRRFRDDARGITLIPREHALCLSSAAISIGIAVSTRHEVRAAAGVLRRGVAPHVHAWRER
jgi:hypothetical protein